MVVDGLSKQVGNVLFAAGAVDRAHILLGEHATLFFWLLSLLSDKHVVQIFDLKTIRGQK